MNQQCKVCEEPAAGFHFGAFTCEGCKSFFGRAHTNPTAAAAIECKTGHDRCVIDKKNRTSCKACRLKKCLAAGMSKSGSRYGRRSNWFKIHCLLQQQQRQPPPNGDKDARGGDSGYTPIITPQTAPKMQMSPTVIIPLTPTPLFFGLAPKSWAPLSRSENSAFRETVKPVYHGDRPIDLTVRQLADDDNNNVPPRTKGNVARQSSSVPRQAQVEDTAAVPLDLTRPNRKFAIRGS